MKKFALFACLLCMSVHAGVPQLPKNIGDYKNLSEPEKEEAGAFFLFYDLAKSKKIGPGSGVCLSYEKSHGGAPAKISINLDTALFESAEAENLALKDEAKKGLTNLLGQIKTYLDEGCKTSECNKERKVTVTGYADATRNKIAKDHQVENIPAGTPFEYSKLGNRKSMAISKNPSNPNVSESINANTNLATRRAMLYAKLAEGFTDNLYVTAQPSPIGEKLRNNENVTLGSPPDQQTLKPGDLQTDCQSRRRAVIDIEFNPIKLEGKDGDKEMGLNISAGSKDFLTLSGMSAAIQAKRVSMELGTKDPDAIIKGILEAQGIKDESIIKGCQNEGTRLIVKESLKRMNSFSNPERLKKPGFEKQLLQNYQNSVSKDPQGNAVSNDDSFFRDIAKTIQEQSTLVDTKNTILGEDGFSSSMMDCFSAKSSMAVALDTNPALKGSQCKSAKEKSQGNSLNISYDPSKHDPKTHIHNIGCSGCGTGFTVAKSTGKSDFSKLYLDRYYGNDFLSPASKQKITTLTDHRPLSRDEIKDYLAKSKVLKNLFDAELPKVKANKELFNAITKARTSFLFHGDTPENYAAIEKLVARPEFKDNQDLKDVFEFRTRLHSQTLSKDKTYFRLVTRQETNLEVEKKDRYELDKEDRNAVEFYETVLYPAVTAQKKLSGWNDDADVDSNQRMTFGGLKNPGYYVIPDCNCQDGDLVEKASRLKPVLLAKFPYNEKLDIKNPENTCIFTPPIPSSCSYKPNESGLKTPDSQDPNKIKWIGADGKQVAMVATEVTDYLNKENKKFGEVDCGTGTPIEQAQNLLNHSQCQGDSALPTTEVNDCSSKKSAAK